MSLGKKRDSRGAVEGEEKEGEEQWSLEEEGSLDRTGLISG